MVNLQAAEHITLRISERLALLLGDKLGNLALNVRRNVANVTMFWRSRRT